MSEITQQLVNESAITAGRKFMTVSIIICTRNRAKDLDLTLRSISRSEVPAGWDVEALVVDNGSNDETRAVVESLTRVMRGAGIRLRYTLEPVAGQCRARNRGLAETTGEIILFTDDDVRVPTGWIGGMSEKIRSGEADLVQGGIRIPERYTIPAEMDARWVASSEDIDPAKPQRMIGANMAFSRKVLDVVDGFDLELGPGALGFHDDALFFDQLMKAGCRVAGALDVVVDHHFDASRLTREGVNSIAAKMGRSNAYVDHHWRHADWWYNSKHDLRLRAKLALWRIRNGWSIYLARRVLRSEGRQLIERAYMDQMKIESKRPRNYEKFGLRKLQGTMIVPAEAQGQTQDENA